MNNEKTQDNILNAVDLHIHTPASSCYNRYFDKSEEEQEYLDIIEKYVERQIDIIAITDHNTIAGYRKLIEIKKNIETSLKTIQNMNNDGSADKIISELEKKIALFNQILILPGIEYETKNNCHILLIFSPHIDINIIECFLCENGYPIKSQGKEDADSTDELLYPEQLFEIASSIGALCIAAHVDSDKGLYNQIQKGSYREEVFSSSFLNGMSYCNDIECERIKGIISSYNRLSPIAFITSSDYHGKGSIPASPISYFKLHKICFESLVEALNNPDECIFKTRDPKTLDTIKKVVSSRFSICFLDFETSIDNIYKAICAVLNNGTGYIVIGVQTNPSLALKGIKQNRKDMNEFIEDAKKKICSRIAHIDLRMTSYPLGNGRVVYIIRTIVDLKCVFSLSNKVYILRKNKVIVADAEEIEIIAEKNILSRLENCYKKNTTRIDSIIKDLNIQKKTLDMFNVIEKINRKGISINKIFDFKIAENNYVELEQRFEEGQSNGNIYYVNNTAPRLDYAYLRTLARRFFHNQVESCNAYKSCGESIIIVPGGAAFLIDSNTEWYLCSEMKHQQLLVCSQKEQEKLSSSIKVNIAWLKSSILLFYLIYNYNDVNLYSSSILRKLRFPYHLDLVNIIDPMINNIVELEKQFLDTYSERYGDTSMDDLQNDEYIELINQHNSKTELIWHNIDIKFAEYYNITNLEFELIYDYLRNNSFFVHDQNVGVE